VNPSRNTRDRSPARSGSPSAEHPRACRRAFRTLRGFVAACLVAATATAQDEEPERTAPPDPYTGGRADALDALGYVRMGRLTWASDHDTARIEEDLGKIPFRWIETAHFRLGCALPKQDVPRDKEDRKALREELDELAQRLPGLKPRSVRELDPWLRAHLFAQRLESLYERFTTLAGVADTAFPAEDAPFFRGDAPPNQKWMGRGPHLGMKGKFLVLLCPTGATCTRYLRTYTEALHGDEMPSRWYFDQADAFLFATAPDYGDGAFQSDRAMHAHVVFNVAHNLIDAFKGYSYEIPAWWKEGLAHVLRREVSTEHNNFSEIDENSQRAYQTFDWDVKVRQRDDNGLIRPLAEILDKTRCTDFDLIDHAACWSRVSFLLDAREPSSFATFLDRMKGQVDSQGAPPDPAVLARIQRDALEEAFGGDPDALDAEWRTWMRRRYRSR
jgi:hypothetical protein